MFSTLLVINYFAKLLLLFLRYSDYIFNGFYATRKIIQMFIVFTVFTQTQKNKSIVHLYQKYLLGCFSEDIKMWPSHVLNW